MANIKRSITVMDCRNNTFHDDGEDFKIVKVKNTVHYPIGNVVSKSMLDQIIKSGVDVTIIPYKKS